MSFINTTKRAEILIKAIMERISNCAVSIDLQNEMLLLANRGGNESLQARIGWAEETRLTMAQSAGIIFDHAPTDKSLLLTSLGNWIPEAVHGLFRHATKRPLDYLAAFENNMQMEMRRPGGIGSGTHLRPS